jgi:hypothetical protein
VGLATFGVLASVGYANERALRSGCHVTDACSHSDVASVRTQYLVGDVALGVGIVSLAVAVGYWALNRPGAGAASAAARLP